MAEHGPTFRCRNAVDPREFEPLPYYSWDSRPASVPLAYDEAATALYLARGDLRRAAAILKVPPKQLQGLIRRSGPTRVLLQRIQSEVRENANDP
jgi:hypothetical protein